jgi:hypothetical protein
MCTVVCSNKTWDHSGLKVWPSQEGSGCEDLNQIRVIFPETLLAPSFISSSRYSVFSVLTRLQIGRPRNRGSIHIRDKRFLQSIQTGCRSHPVSHSVGPGGSFSGSNAASAWSWQLTQSLAEVKNEWSYIYTSTSPLCLFGVYRNSCTLCRPTSFSFFRTRYCVYYFHNNNNNNNINVTYAWFQASAAMLMRSALFWNITQRRVVILYRRFGTDRLSRNIGTELPLFAASYPRRAQISTTWQFTWNITAGTFS